MNRLAVRALAFALVLAFAPAAFAENAVGGIDVTELEDATEIRIHAFEHPSYSVYRLRNPLRVFVDITDSELTAEGVVHTIDNGVVSQIATTQYADELATVTRIVIGFDQEALYNVDSDGTDLVVTVEGIGRNLFVAMPPQNDNEFALLESALASVSERVVALTRAVAVAESAGQADQVEGLRYSLNRETAERDRLLFLAGRGSDEELAGIQAELEESYARVETLEADRSRTQEGLHQAEAELQDQQSMLTALESERGTALAQIEALQAQALSHDHALGDRDGRIAELQAELVGMNQQIQSLEVSGADADALAALNAQRTTQLVTLEAEQAELRELLDAAATNEAALEGALQMARTSQEDQQALIQEQSETIAELEESYARVETLEADRSRTQEGLHQAEADLQDQQSMLTALESERGTALAQIEALQAQALSHDHALGDRDGRIAELQAELVGMNQQIQSLEVSGADADALAALNAQRTTQLVTLETEQAELRELLDAAATNEAALEGALQTARTSQEDQQALIQEQSETIAELERQRAEPVEVTAGPIQDIRFEHVDGVDRVVIDGSAGLTFETLPYEDGRSGIVFGDTTLPDRLRRTLDTQAFGGPVAFVSSYTDADGTVRVVAELGSAASEVLRQEGDALVWEFTQAVEDYDDSATAMLNSAGEPYAGSVNSYQTGDSQASNGGGRRGSPSAGDGEVSLPRPRMTRKRITIDLRDADIQNVLRMIADEGNINIVAGDGVDGNVTLRLRSVPLDDALVVILRSQNLGWEQQGSIIRVAPISQFNDAYERELARLSDQWMLEPLNVRILPLGYADATEVSGLVSGVISERGWVSVDQRNNALIVTDVQANLDVAQALCDRVDTQTPQVLIEARIVETNDQFRRQLGIQWGFDFIADQSLGNATGLLFPSTFGVAGGADDGQSPTSGSSSTPNWAVNLPAPAGTGTGGAVGFTFGSLSQAFNLNLRLSAAEDTGSVKIISAPRIMTLDNVAASITSGVSIPVSVISAAGAQTQFVDASLTLDVTPRVTPDGNVFLDVAITKNEPDFENTGARGDPSIVRREARTQLLVRDGDTTVIGGIFTRNSGLSTSRIPFFGSLPVIGPLFRNSSQSDIRTELLVFITPRIVNRDLSIDALTQDGQIQTIQRD